MRRTALVSPFVLTAALAGAYLIVGPPSADLAAQVYRTDLFKAAGFTLWNAQWYGGHHTLAYSVLFPPLAATLGPQLVGALAAGGATAAFAGLARGHFGDRARIGVWWFAAASVTSLLSGRLPFELGMALGLAALLALQRRRPFLAAALAATCPLASPVAGLFLALAAIALALARRSRPAAVAAVAALVPVLALAIAFPDGGVEPFVFSAFWPVPVACLLALALLPREYRTLRTGAALYGLAATAAFLLATPMGGNTARLGALFAGPVFACALWRRHRWLVVAMALPLLYWQWSPPLRDVAKAAGDPAVGAAYYLPLNGFLARHAEPPARVEIPSTANHWENVYVAQRFPLARGWERQLDLKYARPFYTPNLTAAVYHAWLQQAGVRYVALPDAKLDYSGRAEAALIRAGLPFLRPVWSSLHWRVYALRDPEPLVGGSATVTRLGPDFIELDATRPGVVVLRERFTPYWRLSLGYGCVERTADGLTRVTVKQPGLMRVDAGFTAARLLDGGPRCNVPDHGGHP